MNQITVKLEEFDDTLIEHTLPAEDLPCFTFHLSWGATQQLTFHIHPWSFCQDKWSKEFSLFTDHTVLFSYGDLSLQ